MVLHQKSTRSSSPTARINQSKQGRKHRTMRSDRRFPARQSLLLVLLATLVLGPACVRASVYSGFTVARQFEYIGKFCFTWKPTLDELAGVCGCSTMLRYWCCSCNCWR